MGLAASQARLLTITARKSDCEFLSMSLSHQKIALARDMEVISDEYQKALNKTRLVYDYYGSGTSQMNLDYGLLMTPSIYNDYYPKFLTDNNNRVVLDAKYASAAQAAGIPPEGYMGTPSSHVRDRFVEALADSNTISTSTAVAIQSVPYNNATGLGGGITSTVSTREVSWSDLKEIIAANCDDTDTYGLQLSGVFSRESDQFAIYPNMDFIANGTNSSESGEIIKDSGDSIYFSSYDSSNTNTGEIWNNSLSKNTGDSANIKLLDLLDGKQIYTIGIGAAKGAAKPITEAAFLQQYIVGSENSTSFLNWLDEQFRSVLGGVSLNEQALQYAYDQVYDLVYPNENVVNAATKLIAEHPEYCTGDRHDREDYPCGEGSPHEFFTYLDEMATRTAWQWGSGNKRPDVQKGAADYIGAVYSACSDAGNRNQWQIISINLNNLAKVYLTAFMEYTEGIENTNYSYELGQTLNGKDDTSKARLYDPSDSDKFTVAGDTFVADGTDNLVANFYDALFNMICNQGWTRNDNVSDSDYMQEMLKSGAMYLSTINNDGNYYQGNYSLDTYIAEIADNDGVAQAEAKYNAEKAKIENKENRIDAKMKNLDTEISSLTTEYDTVKNIINKAVEKSFKRYDA